MRLSSCHRCVEVPVSPGCQAYVSRVITSPSDAKEWPQSPCIPLRFRPRVCRRARPPLLTALWLRLPLSARRGDECRLLASGARSCAGQVACAQGIPLPSALFIGRSPGTVATMSFLSQPPFPSLAHAAIGGAFMVTALNRPSWHSLTVPKDRLFSHHGASHSVLRSGAAGRPFPWGGCGDAGNVKFGSLPARESTQRIVTPPGFGGGILGLCRGGVCAWLQPSSVCHGWHRIEGLRDR